MFAMTGNTSAVTGYTRVHKKFKSLKLFQKNYIIARDQKSDMARHFNHRRK